MTKMEAPLFTQKVTAVWRINKRAWERCPNLPYCISTHLLEEGVFVWLSVSWSYSSCCTQLTAVCSWKGVIGFRCSLTICQSEIWTPGNVLLYQFFWILAFWFQHAAFLQLLCLFPSCFSLCANSNYQAFYRAFTVFELQPLDDWLDTCRQLVH